VYGAVNPVYTYNFNSSSWNSLANGHVIGFSGAQVGVTGENVGNFAINQGTL
jgi:hypothetical protein